MTERSSYTRCPRCGARVRVWGDRDVEQHVCLRAEQPLPKLEQRHQQMDPERRSQWQFMEKRNRARSRRQLDSPPAARGSLQAVSANPQATEDADDKMPGSSEPLPEIPDLTISYYPDKGHLEVPLESSPMALDNLPGTVTFQREQAGRASAYALWLNADQAQTLSKLICYTLKRIDNREQLASPQGTATLRALHPEVERMAALDRSTSSG